MPFSNPNIALGVTAKNTAMCIGDSLVANGWAPTVNDITVKNRGWINWICLLLNQRIRVEDSFAVGGSTMTDILDQYYDNIDSFSHVPRYVFISGGGNDLLADPTQNTLTAVKNSYIQLFNAARSRDQVVLVLVNGAMDSALTDPVRDVFYDFNTWLMEYASQMDSVIPLDGFQVVLDADSADGKPLANMLYDSNIHYSSLAAQRIGVKAANTLRDLLPKVDPFYVSFNDTHGSYPNLSPNGVLSGTSGSISGITGDVADSWTGIKSGTVTVVGSKVASSSTEDFNGDWQRFVLSSGSGANETTMFTTITTGFTIGESVYSLFEVATSGLNEIAAVYLEIRCRNSGGTTISRARTMIANDSSFGSIEDFSGVLRTPLMEVVTGTDNIQILLKITSNTGSTNASGTVDLRRNSLRHVQTI